MKLREIKQNIPQTPNFRSQFEITNNDVNKKYEEKKGKMKETFY